MTSAGSVRTPVEGALVGWLQQRPPTSARLPVGVLTRTEKAAELGRLQARRAMDAAYEAELVMALMQPQWSCRLVAMSTSRHGGSRPTDPDPRNRPVTRTAAPGRRGSAGQRAQHLQRLGQRGRHLPRPPSGLLQATRGALLAGHQRGVGRDAAFGRENALGGDHAAQVFR